MYPALEQSFRRITIRLRSPNADFLRHHPNRGVSEDDFGKLVGRFSDYQGSKTRIELMLPVGHPDLQAIYECAMSLGLVIEPNSKEQSQVEILDYTKPPEEDVAASQYLECGLFDPVIDGAVDVDGDLGIAFSSEKLAKSNKQEFGSIPNLPHLIVVRRAAKKIIESSQLVGLELIKMHTDLTGDEWPNDSDPLFLIWSSVILPGVSSEILQTNLGSRLEDKYEVRPQLRFVDDLPRIDVAVTREVFGSSECYRRIIYSQKAKSVLEEVGMKLECVPVRIERGAVGPT